MIKAFLMRARRYRSQTYCLVVGLVIGVFATSAIDGRAIYFLNLHEGPWRITYLVHELREVQMDNRDQYVKRLEDELDERIVAYPGLDKTLQYAVGDPEGRPYPLSFWFAQRTFNRINVTPPPLMIAKMYRQMHPYAGEKAALVERALKPVKIDGDYARATSWYDWKLAREIQSSGPKDTFFRLAEPSVPTVAPSVAKLAYDPTNGTMGQGGDLYRTKL